MRIVLVELERISEEEEGITCHTILLLLLTSRLMAIHLPNNT